ncbi:hypothetical protein LIER_35807 [Lithospermum erythrorhizon]|uniref:CCHC-type domain-containing protein n=1 Tax=Lithospermum erythrorhizon TaxID=34254 RepID=A0AAV3NXE3_LITER
MMTLKVGRAVGSGYLAYERLPHLCFHCGHLGHLIRQCPSIPEGSDPRRQEGSGGAHAQPEEDVDGGVSSPRVLADYSQKEFSGDLVISNVQSSKIEHLLSLNGAEHGYSHAELMRGFYDHHETSKRRHSWNLMRLINGLSTLPTIFMGDFNEVLLSSEHVSQRRHRSNWQMEHFLEVVNDCGIFDIEYEGFQFTWCNNFVSPNSTRARLDMGLANQSWKDSFPEARLTHLSTNNSDHFPILLEVESRVQNGARQKPRFRFEGGRGKTNLITTLQDEAGNWHKDLVDIHDLATRFYTTLFTSQARGNLTFSGQLLSNQLAVEALERMEAIFTNEEVKKCLFSMNGSKAPRPDRMLARFFQHYWATVGDTLCNMVIAKVLADRLKKFLPSVILETQSAFVPDRLITNNILLEYEAHHVIKHKKSGKEGYISIKLDMLKAYDRIERYFLKAMLTKLGFSMKWITLIMTYVESVTYSLLINEEHVGAELQGLKLGTDSNPISHLMFAADILLLGKATTEEPTVIKNILHTYEDCSGQYVSTQKSTVLFSPNFDEQTTG